MSDDFSYRDPQLSIWQAAAEEVHCKHSLAKGVTVQQFRARPAQNRNQDPLMAPVHLVANVAKGAGKPFEWLAGEVRRDFST